MRMRRGEKKGTLEGREGTNGGKEEVWDVGKTGGNVEILEGQHWLEGRRKQRWMLGGNEVLEGRRETGGMKEGGSPGWRDDWKGS